MTVTDRHFAAIRSRDIDSLIALYADDATFILPNGEIFSGTAAIREMHLGVFAAGALVPTPTALIAGDGCVAVEASQCLSSLKKERYHCPIGVDYHRKILLPRCQHFGIGHSKGSPAPTMKSGTTWDGIASG